MLYEDSKKIEAEKTNSLNKEELAAFTARKQRLKDDGIIDLDAKPKKQSGRPKGSKIEKDQKK